MCNFNKNIQDKNVLKLAGSNTLTSYWVSASMWANWKSTHHLVCPETHSTFLPVVSTSGCAHGVGILNSVASRHTIKERGGKKQHTFDASIKQRDAPAAGLASGLRTDIDRYRSITCSIRA